MKDAKPINNLKTNPTVIINIIYNIMVIIKLWKPQLL